MKFQTRSITAVALLAALSVVTACSTSTRRADDASDHPATMDTLVTAEWLNAHLGDPDIVVLDCTVLIEPTEDGHFQSVSGRRSYDAGHIPTAGFADLTGELSNTDSPLEFALPTPEAFAATMGALGVGDDSRVVLYSAGNPVWAARVWWMLRWIGFDRAALLDGGLAAWTAAGLPVSTDPVSRPAGTLTPRVRPDLIADQKEVLDAVDNDAVTLVDVMPAAHYRGEMSMYDRPGHIRSAISVPIMSLVDETGRYRPDDELAAVFGAEPDDRVITYCGGGIAASSAAFILTRLGYTNVAVYAASLQEWTADPDNPMEVESEFEAFDQ